ncbi:hypothetical protein GOP47_0012719 [Adiantum capillus-veneris]|uniref:Uncharacterized protein n=1 Tax=Adiantum capillus-veneris TaxID=13818 RepID=A0A9D4UR81_ADICA|nr:hypothetical protein GOP47_0012719 [Adiantum capillus-veneris]
MAQEGNVPSGFGSCFPPFNFVGSSNVRIPPPQRSMVVPFGSMPTSTSFQLQHHFLIVPLNGPTRPASFDEEVVYDSQPVVSHPLDLNSQEPSSTPQGERTRRMDRQVMHRQLCQLLHQNGEEGHQQVAN